MNVMKFNFPGKVMDMSWNLTKMSWKKYAFANFVNKKENDNDDNEKKIGTFKNKAIVWQFIVSY